jgi:hypothetical protein
MTLRTVWALERLPQEAARGRRGTAVGGPDGEAISLPSMSARSFDVRRGRSLEVRCIAGLVHVTFEGDIEDHFLRAGESFRVDGRGRLAVVGLEPSRVTLVEASGYRVEGFARRWSARAHPTRAV